MAESGSGSTQKDARNLQRVKDAMADKPQAKKVYWERPDAAAAAAFAALLNAETRRAELAGEVPGAGKEIRVHRLPWKSTESVGTAR